MCYSSWKQRITSSPSPDRPPPTITPPAVDLWHCPQGCWWEWVFSWAVSSSTFLPSVPALSVSLSILQAHAASRHRPYHFCKLPWSTSLLIPPSVPFCHLPFSWTSPGLSLHCASLPSWRPGQFPQSATACLYRCHYRSQAELETISEFWG